MPQHEERRPRRKRWLLVVYGLLAVLITWPVVLSPATLVPGGERTDLWNSLWSTWFVARSLWSGELPLWTALLDHPDGGWLLVADPLNALAAAPLIPLLGAPLTWSLLAMAHVTFSGVMAHLLAEAVVRRRGAGWIAGVGYAASPVLISGLHNGNGESFSGGWLPLALLACLAAVRQGGLRRILVAGLALGCAALASWYGGLLAFLGATSLALVGEGAGPLRPRLVRGGAAMLVGLLLAAPLAVASWSFATRDGNLVRIKEDSELSLVRRSTGAADPLGWFMPGDYRSPDFRILSRYGEGYVHSHYLGWLLILGTLGAALQRDRRRALTWLLLAGLVAGLLAMGPVVVRHGRALLLPGERALPLPYLLLEDLPGFSSLSLLFRLAQLPSLALAVAASALLAGRRGALLPAAMAALVLLELRVLSPVRGLPEHSDARMDPAIVALGASEGRASEGGAVMNFPVAGGRRYIYHQVEHGQPLAGTLNFPNNRASQAVWRAILEADERWGADLDGFRIAVEEAACEEGIRYLVSHVDPMARPDMHDRAVRAVRRGFEPLTASGAVSVYQLCPANAPDVPLDGG